eukprot:3209114-Prymnesium_polylepis.3
MPTSAGSHTFSAHSSSLSPRVVICISGHLRNRFVSADALATVERHVILGHEARTAAVLSTWDVYGQRSRLSKLYECYDMAPVVGWRCPSFISRCEVLNFASHFAVLVQTVRRARSGFANNRVSVERARTGSATNGSALQYARGTQTRHLGMACCPRR